MDRRRSCIGTRILFFSLLVLVCNTHLTSDSDHPGRDVTSAFACLLLRVLCEPCDPLTSQPAHQQLIASQPSSATKTTKTASHPGGFASDLVSPCCLLCLCHKGLQPHLIPLSCKLGKSNLAWTVWIFVPALEQACRRRKRAL